jgi:hypothetical protein
MGASGWSYWVPYEADLQSALEKLRARVFAEGSYFKGWGEYEVKSPASIEDLFDQMGELGTITEGTHSILDMDSVGVESEHGVLCPLTDEELVAKFGTTKPSRAQIEAEESALQSWRYRWEGTYVVAYDGESPTEILFVGFSGD